MFYSYDVNVKSNAFLSGAIDSARTVKHTGHCPSIFMDRQISIATVTKVYSLTQNYQNNVLVTLMGKEEKNDLYSLYGKTTFE